MQVYKLIQLLANVCAYNADGEVYIHIGNKNYPLDHCIDNWIDGKDGKRQRTLVMVSEKHKDYYGT